MTENSQAASIEARLLARRSLTPEGCWEWLGHRSPDGYGGMTVGSRIDGTRRSVHTHRVSYEIFVGPISDGLHIDHLCRNRACFNPLHLEPVTPRENTLRSPVSPATINAAKTHCKRGHELSGENVYTWGGGREYHRLCRPCRHEAVRAYRARKAAAALVEAAREDAALLAEVGRA